MLNFWTLSAIAAFCLGQVLSVNPGDFMNGQSRGVSPWEGAGGAGGLNVPNRGGGGLRQPSTPNLPKIQIGDDELRIACITFNFSAVTFSFGHIYRGV